MQNSNYDFSQIDALKKKLDQLRPLDAVLYSKIMSKFHLDWTYNSNAIEGNTLTLSETRFYLNFGLTSKGHTLSEYLEMKNHKFALNYLEAIIKNKTPLSERLIKDLHAMLFENNEKYEIENEMGQKIQIDVRRGAYKQQNNYVLLPDGSQKWYLDPLKVVDEMQNLIKFYEKNKDKLHPIILAAELHTRFVNIHPFVDGNGRVARLIMNIVLMQAGFAPAIIHNSEKQDYFEALQKYDETAEIDDFVYILEKEVTRTMQIMLNAAEGKSVFDKEDIGKRLDKFSKTMEALDKDIGKVSKKVSREEKEESIRKIRDYLYGIAKDKIEGFKNDYITFLLDYPSLEMELNFCEELEKYLEKNSIYKDDLINQIESCFTINLDSNREFIPLSECSIVVVPSKYTLYVFCIIAVSSIISEDEDFDVNSKNHFMLSLIQNGILWEDWHKEDLDNFFNEVFEQFLEMVEQEAELRRIRIEEEKGR